MCYEKDQFITYLLFETAHIKATPSPPMLSHSLEQTRNPEEYKSMVVHFSIVSLDTSRDLEICNFQDTVIVIRLYL